MGKGFKTLHTMDAFDNAMHENYREVGLGFDNGQQDGTINVHWSVWYPRHIATKLVQNIYKIFKVVILLPIALI